MDIIYHKEMFGVQSSLNTPTFKAFIDEIEHLSIDESLDKFDGSNACMFLAVDISSQILLSRDIRSPEEIAQCVQDIIITRPQVYNKVRDRARMYEVNEVLDIMGAPVINNGMIQFCSPNSQDLCKKISSCIYNALKVSRDGSTGIFRK